MVRFDASPHGKWYIAYAAAAADDRRAPFFVLFVELGYLKRDAMHFHLFIHLQKEEMNKNAFCSILINETTKRPKNKHQILCVNWNYSKFHTQINLLSPTFWINRREKTTNLPAHTKGCLCSFLFLVFRRWSFVTMRRRKTTASNPIDAMTLNC